jgi:hypothetical protein
MIVLITPTGARPRQVELCAKWMQRQTYKGAVRWVIVDDAIPQTTHKLAYRPDWQVDFIYPRPPWQQGQNTQGRNIKAGIDYIKQNIDLQVVKAIFIIEDDDYYKPIYLEEMVKRLGGYDIIGETHTMYYNVTERAWVLNLNERWSSLFQTAFTPALIPLLEMSYGEKFIDLQLFKLARNKLLFRAGDLSIGIKGQAGRGGIGCGHRRINGMTDDKNGAMLYELIGYDAAEYLPDICFKTLNTQAVNRVGTG